MKHSFLLRTIFWLLLLALNLYSGCLSLAQEARTLEQRIKSREPKAMKEAVEHHRTDLIPLIEEVAKAGKHPSGPARRTAYAVLAKFGVKKYLDAIVQEVAHPETTDLFKEQNAYYRSDKIAAWATRKDGLESLTYIDDESTVKYIGPLLSSTEQVDDGVTGGFDVAPIGPIAILAANALGSMNLKKTPPASDKRDPDPSFVVEKWQLWWEQHKDYYEKIEYGKPPPQLPRGDTGKSKPTSAVTSQPAHKAEPSPKTPATSTAPTESPSSTARSWAVPVIVAVVVVLIVRIAIVKRR